MSDVPTIRLVLENEACVGCGACAVALPDVISMVDTGLGYQKAQILNADLQSLEEASRICPFADESPSEDEHAMSNFPQVQRQDSVLGKYLSVHFGRVTDDSEVSKSSSGGLTTYVTNWLLTNRKIDAVIHVGASEEDALFDYTLSTAADSGDVRKSNYYSCSMDQAIKRVLEVPGRYAFIGVPCYVSALRNLKIANPVLQERVQYCFALVCGHMKSSQFAESMAWQLGIRPAVLSGVDFRVKSGAGTASGYGFKAWSRSGRVETSSKSSDLFGANWGYGAFQLNACNYCDDIFGETADATFGDAWLPEFESNWRGTNVVVTRDPLIEQIICEGIRDGQIDGGSLDSDTARSTQLGNIRHRRDGLAVRLRDDAEAGKWSPKKRVSTAIEDLPSESRQRIARRRRLLSKRSFVAFGRAKVSGRLVDYPVLMASSLLKYEMAYALSMPWKARARLFLTTMLRIAKVVLQAAVIDAKSSCSEGVKHDLSKDQASN